MNPSLFSLSLLIGAYAFYHPSLPVWAVFGLTMMVLVGVFGCVIGYMVRFKAFSLWLERHF